MNAQELISYQDKFKSDIQLIAQQMRPRLMDIVDDEPDALDARFFWFNHVGLVTPRLKTAFAGPTPNMSPAHSRRQGSLQTYEWGDVFDDTELRTLVENPEAKHKKAAVAGFYRMMDSTIINAGLGQTVDYNANGTTTVNTLPAAQVIASGGAGLTFTKVIQTKIKFDAAEVDETVPNPTRVFAVTHSQLGDLLNTIQATESFYVDVKALVRGEIDEWMGFKWVRTEQLPLNGAGERRCIAFAQGAIGAFMQMEPEVFMAPDPGASFANRIYMTQNLGATRQEDVRVIEVDCVESFT